MPRQRNLCAGITVFLEMAPDQPVNVLKGRCGKA